MIQISEDIRVIGKCDADGMVEIEVIRCPHCLLPYSLCYGRCPMEKSDD